MLNAAMQGANPCPSCYKTPAILIAMRMAGFSPGGTGFEPQAVHHSDAGPIVAPKNQMRGAVIQVGARSVRDNFARCPAQRCRSGRRV